MDSLLLVNSKTKFTRTAARSAPSQNNCQNLLEQRAGCLMGFIQNQTLTLGLSKPDVIYWETSSAAVNNIIVVLGVLTFALQLCFVLLFMLRCWRFDNRVQEALKHPDSANKLSELPFFHRGISKELSYSLCDDAADASSPAMSAAVYKYKHTTDFKGPSIPWDLVQ